MKFDAHLFRIVAIFFILVEFSPVVHFYGTLTPISLFEMTIFELYVLLLVFIWKVPQRGEAISCNFESGDVCGWENENFTVSQYKSKLEQSGPEQAFEGEFYAFFYEEQNIESGAILEFTVQESNENCLFLAYHMWGSHIGSLDIEVYNTTANLWIAVKTFKGDLGNMWHCNGIELRSIDNTDTKLKVRIHALRGDGRYSIIGIDDVRVFEAPGSTCVTYNCGHLPQNTGSSAVTSYSPTFSGSPRATTTETTQTSDFFKENLPLIAGIPMGLVTFFVIIGIVYLLFQKDKKDKRDKANHDDFIHGQPPLGFRADRYRSFPHNHHHQEEEVYDEIKDDNRTSQVNNLNYRSGSQNNGFTESYPSDDYLTPSSVGENGNDSYLTPVSLQDKDLADYTVLPAITLPVDQVTVKYNQEDGDTQNRENNVYIEPKDLNMPKTRGKTISISDQGETVYTDVRQHREYSNENMVNRPYTSLSTIRYKR